jgi:hypothetical protein
MVIFTQFVARTADVFDIRALGTSQIRYADGLDRPFIMLIFCLQSRWGSQKRDFGRKGRSVSLNPRLPRVPSDGYQFSSGIV